MNLISLPGQRYINPRYVVSVIPYKAWDETLYSMIEPMVIKHPHCVEVRLEGHKHPEIVECASFAAAEAKAKELAVDIDNALLRP